MVKVKIMEAPAILAVGRKTWISGQDNAAFGAFWNESNANGLIERLHLLTKSTPGEITKSYVFGISCVEKDPDNRAFDFFIAAEVKQAVIDASLENYTIPAATWAIFENSGTLPFSLVEAEMYAFMEWLPSSGYRHANAPELEVYPAHDNNAVEFWLPITPKEINN